MTPCTLEKFKNIFTIQFLFLQFRQSSRLRRVNVFNIFGAALEVDRSAADVCGSCEIVRGLAHSPAPVTQGHHLEGVGVHESRNHLEVAPTHVGDVAAVRNRSVTVGLLCVTANKPQFPIHMLSFEAAIDVATAVSFIIIHPSHHFPPVDITLIRHCIEGFDSAFCSIFVLTSRLA